MKSSNASTNSNKSAATGAKATSAQVNGSPSKAAGSSTARASHTDKKAASVLTAPPPLRTAHADQASVLSRTQAAHDITTQQAEDALDFDQDFQNLFSSGTAKHRHQSPETVLPDVAIIGKGGTVLSAKPRSKSSSTGQPGNSLALMDFPAANGWSMADPMLGQNGMPSGSNAMSGQFTSTGSMSSPPPMFGLPSAGNGQPGAMLDMMYNEALPAGPGFGTQAMNLQTNDFFQSANFGLSDNYLTQGLQASVFDPPLPQLPTGSVVSTAPVMPAQPFAANAVTSRPTYSMGKADTLQNLASLFYGNAQVAHLIADLNASKFEETWSNNTRVVVFRSGQTIDLPVIGEIEQFLYSGRRSNAEIITVVIKESESESKPTKKQKTAQQEQSQAYLGQVLVQLLTALKEPGATAQ